MVHNIAGIGKGKPESRAGYEHGDFGRLQGTEGLPLNREQRRAKARLERKQVAKQKAARNG